MSKSRTKLVDMVFKYLAAQHPDERSDVITYMDIANTYSVEKHPKFLSGEWTKKKCLEEFMHTFEPDPARRDGLVSNAMKITNIN